MCSFKFLTDIYAAEKQNEILNHHHVTKLCHRVISEPYEAITTKYYWLNMKNHTLIFEYEVCQKTKYERYAVKIKYNLILTTQNH